MYFDDRLATVLRSRASGPATARILYRQLLDLLGTMPVILMEHYRDPLSRQYSADVDYIFIGIFTVCTVSGMLDIIIHAFIPEPARLDRPESITLGVFMAVLIFLITQFTAKKVQPLGVLVMPVAFVLLGWAGTLMKEVASTLAPALQSWWIWVHIIGASTGFASVLIAAGLGLMYLLRETRSGGIYEKLPAPQALDNLAYRFIAGGFIMYGLMIVSGCFWSNTVKGNYWNWDPVEVWSLISWLIYGIYLHLRITFGWRGRRLAVYALFALIVMIVSYWGIPFGVETFHSGFRIEHN
jgi:cytochrome c-type biogenesis protein CcsB